jgi:hypothetical protein
MSASEYEDRKSFLERLPGLVKDEFEEIFRIVKQSGIPWSENSNGIFFDVNALPADVFEKLKGFMDFCMQNRAEQEERIRMMEVLKTEVLVPTA